MDLTGGAPCPHGRGVRRILGELALCVITVAGCAAPPAGTPAPLEAPPALPEAAPEEPEVDPAALPDPSTLPGKIAVRMDRPVFVAHGPLGERRAILYLHGRCGDPLAFRAWAAAASRLGTVISIQGDVRCPGGQRATWSHDLGALDRRASQALAAVGAARGMPLDEASLTVVGYSLGAMRAEELVKAFPRRYRRALLVAGPFAPEPASFGEGAAVAVIAGGRDLRRHLREGAAALADAGVTSTFLLLPGASHGEYGPEGARVMGEALTWVYQRVP